MSPKSIQKTIQSKVNQNLNLDFSGEERLWLSRQETLRKLVGILGITLPLLLYSLLFIYSQYPYPLESISHYYYTRVSSLFVVTLSLLAIFLLIYQGKEPIDFYISSAAGLFALFVVLFPTSALNGITEMYTKQIVVLTMPISDFRKGVHYASAGIFLSCLAYMSLVLFTKSNLPPSARPRNKKIRNRLFRTCGVLIILSMLVIAAGFLEVIKEPFYTAHHLTFWMETIAVESFGISWLVKGYS